MKSTTTNIIRRNINALRYYATCPHAAVVETANTENSQTTNQQHSTNAINENARPYSEVPGPKPLPLLGNTWR